MRRERWRLGPGMPPHAPYQREREALCDLLLALGPDAPTLCEGWTTADLAAHLVVRERNPVASIGIVLGPAAGLHDRAVERAKRRSSYTDLVERIRRGAPLHWKPVDTLFNTQEYFVHHEDVRRGGGDHTPRPDDEIAELDDAVWAMLRRGGGYATRACKGMGIDLVRPDGETIHARRGEPHVSLVGRPTELVLYLMGRRDAAQVKLEGDPDAIARVEGTDLGV